MKQKEIITKNSEETGKIGISLTKRLSGGDILALSGDLGSGKTTFAQGILQGLGAEAPYTSPTFIIMKEYMILNNKNVKRVYHIDAYRIGESDLIELGWGEIINNKKNIIIIEWAEKVQKIIPQKTLKIDFYYINERKRKIIFN